MTDSENTVQASNIMPIGTIDNQTAALWQEACELKRRIVLAEKVCVALARQPSSHLYNCKTDVFDRDDRYCTCGEAEIRKALAEWEAQPDR